MLVKGEIDCMARVGVVFIYDACKLCNPISESMVPGHSSRISTRVLEIGRKNDEGSLRSANRGGVQDVVFFFLLLPPSLTHGSPTSFNSSNQCGTRSNYADVVFPCPANRPI